MNGENDVNDDKKDDENGDSAADNDTVEVEVSGDTMVEGVHEATVVDADVESLVARIDNTDEDEATRKRAVRRKLEEKNEKREKDLDSTFNFNIDEEL